MTVTYAAQATHHPQTGGLAVSAARVIPQPTEICVEPVGLDGWNRTEQEVVI